MSKISDLRTAAIILTIGVLTFGILIGINSFRIENLNESIEKIKTELKCIRNS